MNARSTFNGRHTTRLVWNERRLAGLVGFILGLIVAVLIVMALDAIPEEPCYYRTPLLPVEGCTLVLQ